MLKRILIWSVAFILILSANNILAYDSDNVHPKINEEASRASLIFQNVLKNLGYIKGVDDSLTINISKKIFEYFREGGTKEDETHCRSRNHFHDP